MRKVDSISHRSFFRSCPVTPDPFRDDDALPDAQVIICVVNGLDTLLLAKPISQRTATQKWFIWEDGPNPEMAKCDVPLIK